MTLLGCGYNGLGQVAPELLVQQGDCIVETSGRTRLYNILPKCKNHQVKLAKWGFSISKYLCIQ
jgi:predicted restriction endonuclease